MFYAVHTITRWIRGEDGSLTTPILGRKIGESQTYEGATRILRRHRKRFPNAKEMRIVLR